MTHSLKHPSDLLRLAHDSSPSARMELISALDSFLRDTASTVYPAALLTDIFTALIVEADPAFRAKLAEKLALSPSVPKEFLRDLAVADLDLAAPVLRYSQSFSDQELVEIVGLTGENHHVAVADRQALNEAVADALVMTGSIAVMETVLKNSGAVLSQKATALATEAARLNAVLQAPLLKRPEIRADQAASLYWCVAQELRREILSRHGVTSGQIEEGFTKLLQDLMAPGRLDPMNDQAMATFANWLYNRRPLNASFMIQILRLRHFRLFIFLIARATGLPPAAVETVINVSGGRTLAVLGHVLGIERAAFVSIFLLSRGARGGDQVVPPGEVHKALATYERLNPSMAGRVFDSWKNNPDMLIRFAERQAV
jgi:uncharacterized protein (DUF2336 family)